ncbi:hypothetical protein O4214_30320 [Rhodococcus erythropolis]|uniref:hypothetical protein n=1 Tax=Rhodococcus erythropolis TaxID=1833 RepID=UPI001E5108BE|nr:MULTISPECIES: hypothetical protein [Rhodococcus erythropolis group]MCD2109361.1 hypothetical protein [Rhodococcus qingshengii]MCZ4528286.1 hypothetical protein [Rhodococcus erythropolis]
MKKTFVGVFAVAGLILTGCSSGESGAAPDALAPVTSTASTSMPANSAAPIVWDRELIMAKLQKAAGEYEACETMGTRECIVATSRGDQVVDSVRVGIAKTPEWTPVVEAIDEARAASALLGGKCLKGLAGQETVEDMNDCTGALRTLKMLPEEAQYRLTQAGLPN